MISLLVALMLSNMPPPPHNPCGGKKVGDACDTPRRTMGVCVASKCQKIEVDKDGTLQTVTSDCLTCPMPAKDAGTTAAAAPSPAQSEQSPAQQAPPAAPKKK